MTFTYKQLRGLDGADNLVVLRYDGSFIPFDPANTDYQAYLQWLAEGNEPEPAEE
jgi:hypothetical protein